MIPVPVACICYMKGALYLVAAHNTAVVTVGLHDLIHYIAKFSTRSTRLPGAPERRGPTRVAAVPAIFVNVAFGAP